MTAQIVPELNAPQLYDATKKYVLSPPQEQAMKNWKATAEIAHRKHDQQAFSNAHHQWFLACRQAVKDNGWPLNTAICDYDKNIVRGKDAR